MIERQAEGGMRLHDIIGPIKALANEWRGVSSNIFARAVVA